jgi:hypothetical protein
MPITPNDWSVVVVGHWNRAILTPAGIVHRLLKLPEDTPVNVEIALDAFLPYRVRKDNVIVTPYGDRLHVEPTVHSFEAFADAMKKAWNAIDSLPETPVVAAGFNLNYKTSGQYPSLSAITAHSWDDHLIERGDFKIDARSIARSLPWRGGHIKLSVTQDADNAFIISMNYDRRSTSVNDLKDWLSIPIQDIEAATKRILSDCLDLTVGEIRNGE